jgi:hypothetical protein
MNRMISHETGSEISPTILLKISAGLFDDLKKRVVAYNLFMQWK